MFGERLWASLLLGGLTFGAGVSLIEQQARISAAEARADEARLIALEGRLSSALYESRMISWRLESTGEMEGLLQERKAILSTFPSDAEMVELADLRKRVRKIDQFMTLRR